jgi:hypothetical protein
MNTLIKILLSLCVNAYAIFNIATSVKEFKKDHYYLGGLCMTVALLAIHLSAEAILMA